MPHELREIFGFGAQAIRAGSVVIVSKPTVHVVPRFSVKVGVRSGDMLFQ